MCDKQPQELVKLQTNWEYIAFTINFTQKKDFMLNKCKRQQKIYKEEECKIKGKYDLFKIVKQIRIRQEKEAVGFVGETKPLLS